MPALRKGVVNVKFDIGSLDGNGGWAVSADIGRLSIIMGDLIGRYGLRVAWYKGKWAYFAELTTRGPRFGKVEA